MKVLITATAFCAGLAATSAAAQPLVNLTGEYHCIQACAEGAVGNPAYITQNGWDLELLSEVGVPSRGWVDHPGHIWVQTWNEGAVYSPDGFTVHFDSGTIWQRGLPPPVIRRGG
jgi:hypothetical protein